MERGRGQSVGKGESHRDHDDVCGGSQLRKQSSSSLLLLNSIINVVISKNPCLTSHTDFIMILVLL